MESTTLQFPQPKPLPGRGEPVPYVIVGDDAFALRPNLMKPYGGRMLDASKRVFNYRLSRARRTIENAFGIMSARFQVFRSPINLDAEKTRKVVKAACVLHNFSLARSGTSYLPRGYVDAEDISCGTITNGTWRNAPQTSLTDLQPIETRDRIQIGNQIRQEFESFFMSTGEVPWQHKYI